MLFLCRVLWFRIDESGISSNYVSIIEICGTPLDVIIETWESQFTGRNLANV